MTTKEEIMKSEQLDEMKESISNKLDRQISNRYELWAMGEIDSGWVSVMLGDFTTTSC